MYRQGDVLIVPIETIPGEWSSRTARYSRLRRDKTSIILAAGEATGHHHRVKGTVRRAVRNWQSNTSRKDLILVGVGGAVVSHEEHDPITLPPGTYEIKRQREYAPEEKRRERRVYD